MFGDKQVLALIPARAGSKGLPRKNILEVAGLPLIGWTIRAARHSQFVDRVVVSTDGDEIAGIARDLGADVPFMRPPDLATDDASTRDVVAHCMHEMVREGSEFQLLVLLQPTSPLRTAGDIDAAFGVLTQRQADAVVTVCRAEHSPLWSNTLPPDGDMRDFLRPEVISVPRQALPDYYRINGAIYIATWERLRGGGWFFGPGSYGHIMPTERSLDVDTLFDLQIAECLLRKAQAAGSGRAGDAPVEE